MSTYTLKVTCNTYLKARPVPVVELSDQEKYRIQTEDVLEVTSFVGEGDHYKICLKVPISGSIRWFVFKDHVEIVLIHVSSILEKSQNQGYPFSELDPTNLSSEYQGSTSDKNSCVEGDCDYSFGISDENSYVGSDCGSEVDSLGTYEDVDCEATNVGGVASAGGFPIPQYAPTSASPPIRSAPPPLLQSRIPQTSGTVDTELQGIISGKVLFDTPQQMKVGVSERVSVRITKAVTQDFFEGLSHSQEAKIENIRISRFMAVTLRGDNFKIEPFGNEEQIIEDNDFTQWDWRVAPLKAGNRKLWVSITIQVKVENEQARKTLPVLEKAISVKINPIYSTSMFVGQYWQWFIASAIIPIVGLILSKK